MATEVPGLIAKKRDGHELTDEELHAFVSGVVGGTVAECQIGAMLMAIFLQDLSSHEVRVLTMEMKDSGSHLIWPQDWTSSLVDKHSTGGVGDKVSLVLAPALAAMGMKVPMISGRGLEHTGGTLDKLESIPGFNVALEHAHMTQMLESVGCFIAGQTPNICPADRILYKIRDVTATVSHRGLITASIVSKKAAENISTLVLDVKTGSGAFMSDRKEAAKLAQSMVDCSTSLGIKTVAMLTDMDTPLGNLVGNALEVVESIECLQGKGPQDLLDLVVKTGGHALYANETVSMLDKGCQAIHAVIANGQALSKLCAMLKGQGVDSGLADQLCDPSNDPRTILPHTQHRKELNCNSAGYVSRVDAMIVAKAVHQLGGGRNKPGEAVDWAVGVELKVDVGDQVKNGQVWAVVHHQNQSHLSEITARLQHAIDISSTPVNPRTTRVLEVFSSTS